MVAAKGAILGLTFVLKPRVCSLPLQHTRCFALPCKTTTNRAATFSGATIPKSEKVITENVQLITLKTPKLDAGVEQKPLVILLEWLMAKKKHIHKFADVYLKQGFDVLSVKLKPRQLTWPEKGSKSVAASVLDILENDHAKRPLLIHGFSVGGYLWGEVQLKMAEDMNRYQPLINNFSGAIWDSVVDINEAAVGVPMALFPKNAMLRNACQKYIMYHMKKYEKEATQHWRKSREMFYEPIIKCPTLLLYSKADPIGNPTSYANIRRKYQSMGIPIFEKCWDKSPHVAHYAFHKDEYLAQLQMFLQYIGLLENADQERMPCYKTCVTFKDVLNEPTKCKEISAELGNLGVSFSKALLPSRKRPKTYKPENL